MSDKDPEGGPSRPTKIPHWRVILDQGVLTPEIESWPYEGKGTDEEPYAVTWIDNDPRNPMTWGFGYKWTVTMVMAFATLTVSFTSSAFSGGVADLIAAFRTSEEVATLGLSLFVLGFAIGPLFWAPLSELYGRQILYFITFGCFTAFNAGVTGSKNMATVIILRFFAGSFGSSPLTNSGGVIADCFPARQRGLAMSIFAVAPFLGPALGPVIGGFLGESAGWKWLMGFMAAFTGTMWILGSLLTPETYAPVLLRKRAKRLSKKTGKVYRSKLDIERGTISVGEAYKTALSRPWILLFREPIVLILSIYMAIVYGTLYMMFAAFPIVYQQQRGWSEGIGGLAFLGILVGMIFAITYNIAYDNPRYQKIVDRNGGYAEPEARLPPAMIGGIALPVGLFWFAWTNYPTLPWQASVAAGIPFGFGMCLVFLSYMNYLVDAYTIFAASVLAANSVLRSCFGAGFPLFTTYMYNNLGVHWASSIPAFLALACVPFPFLFYKYGAPIRRKCKYAAESQAFMERIRGGGGQGQGQGPAGEEVDSDAEMEHEDEEKEKEISADDHIPRGHRLEEAEEEAEAFDYSAIGNEEGQEQRRFAPIQSARSQSQARPQMPPLSYEESPYDIDRVNTRESFRRTGSRGSSVGSRESTGLGLSRTKSWRSGKSRK